MLKDSIDKLYINSSRVHLAEFAQAAAESLEPGSLILDAGAGKCPYKPFFNHMQYESSDACQIEGMVYGDITYKCDITSIPVEDNRYDLVLCTQVISELPEPIIALKELNRVLKPGKMLWITASFSYEQLAIHSDYFRFAESGFRHILECAGFDVIQIEWLEGYFGTVAYQLKTAAARVPVKSESFGGGFLGLLGGVFSAIIKPIFYLLAIFYSYFDRRHKYTGRGYPKNYAVIAEKKTGI